MRIDELMYDIEVVVRVRVSEGGEEVCEERATLAQVPADAVSRQLFGEALEAGLEAVNRTLPLVGVYRTSRGRS